MMRRLAGIYEIRADGLVVGLTLDVGEVEVRFMANADADALEVSEREKREVSSAVRTTSTALEPFVGQELTWTWTATNSQGYSDTNPLAFGGIIPNVMIHAIGSEVKVYPIGSERSRT